MAGFGFTPNDPGNNEGEDNDKNRENLEAMMRQMQEQIKQQFEQLGISTGFAGFGIPGFASTSKFVVR